MAKRIRQLAAITAAVVVVMGGIAVGLAATARADTEISCQGNAPMNPLLCTVTVTLTDVTWINLQVTWAPQGVWITGGVGWTNSSCVQNGQKAAIAPAGANDTAPLTVGVTLPFAGSQTCTLTATAGAIWTAGDPGPNLIVLHVFTDGQQPSPSPSPSPSSSPSASAGLVAGYDGKCLNDAGGSTANRAKIQIWSCHQSSAAEQWTYSKDELVFKASKAMCVNAKGTAKNGAPVILWSCTGSANEIWIHKPNGEYVLKAGGGTLCLTDPGHSTQNGTQLVVRTCANAADQHWTLP